MFKSIVVGTDGSERASEAVLAAAELAATQPEAVLHIVTVQKPLSGSAVAAERGWEEEIKTELEQALSNAAEVAKRVCDTRIETHARFGSPAEVLCDIAAHLQADLIVVGNRGMQGGRRLL